MAEAQRPVTPSPRVEPSSAARAPSFDAVLGSARRRMAAFGAVEIALGLAAGAAAGLVVALLLVAALPYSTALRFALVALIPVLALGAAAAVVVRRLAPLRHDLVVGAALEASLRRRGVELGDMVRGAVELRDSAKDGALGRSRALCEAHIASTTKRVVDGGALASLPGVALERAVPTLAAFSCVAVVVAAWMVAGHDSFRARWDRLLTDDGEKRALEERAASLLPLVTDLKLTLRFPAYMQENDEVIPGSSGDINAPRGTEVTVEGRADRALQSANVTVGDQELGATVNGANLTARFVVNDSTTYRFVVVGVKGGKEVDPVAHKITVRADQVPNVTMETPDADATVKINDVIPLSFKATDDVGVTKFRVVAKRQGSARDPYVKDLLEVPNGGLKEVHGTGKLRIDETGARPGDKLSVYIEALDNDAIAGPKAGRSQTRVLTVYSAMEQHKQLIARLDDVKSKMTDSLADELESSLEKLGNGIEEEKRAVEHHKSIAEHHAVMTKSIDDALLALSQDEVATQATRRAIANMKLKVMRAVNAKSDALASVAAFTLKNVAAGQGPKTRLTTAQKGLVERLEQDILYLDDMLQKEKIAEAQQIAEDLKRAQEDLKALIDQYKKSGDEATRKALLDQIQQMRQQMRELMEKLAELDRSLPDEYLNQEGMKGSDLQKQMQDAESIDKLLEEGKLDEAAKALDDMVKQTKKLVDNLEKEGKQYGGDEYKELRDKVNRFASELESLQQAQNENLKSSQQLMDRARRQAEERLKGKLDKVLNDLKKKVASAQKRIDNIDKDSLFLNESEDAAFAKARIDDLKRALDSKDLEDATSAAEEAEAAARSAERSVEDRGRGRFGQHDKATADAKDALSQSRQELEDARKQLAELMPEPSQMMEKGDRAKMGKDADREDQIGENAQKLGQLMQEIDKESPLFGPNHQKMVEDAKDAMQRASRQMRSSDVKGARSSQRQALRQLAQLEKDLKEQSQGGGGGGGGIPMPFPSGGSPGADDDESGDEEGNGRTSHEDVKIPDGSDFKVPDAYRKDILDAMKEGAPSSWAQEVKKYYESLIK